MLRRTSRDLQLTWVRIEDCIVAISCAHPADDVWSLRVPQKPVFRPTAKHEASILNEAHNVKGPVDSSIIGRVFMVGMKDGLYHGGVADLAGAAVHRWRECDRPRGIDMGFCFSSLFVDDPAMPVCYVRGTSIKVNHEQHMFLPLAGCTKR